MSYSYNPRGLTVLLGLFPSTNHTYRFQFCLCLSFCCRLGVSFLLAYSLWVSFRYPPKVIKVSPMVRGEDRGPGRVQKVVEPFYVGQFQFSTLFTLSLTRQGRLSQAPIHLNPVVNRARLRGEATERSIQLFYQVSTSCLLEVLEVIFNPEASIDLRCRNVRHPHDMVPGNYDVFCSVNGRYGDQLHVPLLAVGNDRAAHQSNAVPPPWQAHSPCASSPPARGCIARMR